MASFNKVILIGNLVADPELKETQSGTKVTSFRIAVSRRYTKGENKQTDFIDVVCWRQTAEFVTRYFRKGSAMLVCGQLQTRTWTDQNGQKRYVTEVVADEVSFVERKGSTDGYTHESAPMPTEPPAYSSPMGDSSFEELATDDDLPF